MDSPGYNVSRTDSLFNVCLEDCKEPPMDCNQTEPAPAQKTNAEPIATMQIRTNLPPTQPSTTKTNNPTHSDTNIGQTTTPHAPTTLTTLLHLTTTRLPLLLRTLTKYILLKTTHSHRLHTNQARIATLSARLAATQTLLDKLLELQREGLLSPTETEIVDSAVEEFGKMARELKGVEEEAEGLRRQIEGIGLGMFWRGFWG
jgi:hypothetical protein